MFMKISKYIGILSILTFLLFFSGTQVMAQPQITSISGALTRGSTITITGSGFGTKNPAKPLIWADFESGIDPTSLGIKTSWDQVLHMEWSATDKLAQASDGTGVWGLRADYSNWTNENQKWYIYRRQRLSFIVDSGYNWKSWRVWPTTGSYPDILVAPSNGRVYVETGVPGETGYWTGDISHNDTNWHTEEFIGRASSAIDTFDGVLTLKYDGQQVATGPIMTRVTDAPAYMTQNFVALGVKATGTWSTDNRMWIDAVYADTTWARVIIGDASTYANLSKVAIQIPSAWSDSEISITVNNTSFTGLNNTYLYVIDTNGNVNSTGYYLCPDCPSVPKNLQAR